VGTVERGWIPSRVSGTGAARLSLAGRTASLGVGLPLNHRRLRVRLRGDGAALSLPGWCAGGWPFPRVPLGFRASPRVLRGSIPAWHAGAASCVFGVALGLVLSYGDDCSELSALAVLAGRLTILRWVASRGCSPVGLLSWGCPKIAPPSTSALRVHSRPTLLASESPRHRPGAATSQTRSVLAVPPGFDGLLRAMPCRSVAPCSQPWGSPRFGLVCCRPFRARPDAIRCGVTTTPLCVRPRPPAPQDRSPGSLGPSDACPLARVPTPLARPASPRASRGVATTVCLRFRAPLPLCSLLASQLRRRSRELVPARCLPRDAPPFGVFPSPVAVPRHRGRCPLAVHRICLGSSLRVAASLRSALLRWRPQGLAPPSSPLLHTGSPLPAARRCRRPLRRFSHVLRPILPWACVTFRVLPRRSADWLPGSGRSASCDTGTRPPLPAGRRTLVALPRRTGGETRAQAAGPRHPPQTRRTGCGARDETRREVAVGCRAPCDQPTTASSFQSSRRRRSCSARSIRTLLPWPQRRPSDPKANRLRRHRCPRATEVVVECRCARHSPKCGGSGPSIAGAMSVRPAPKSWPMSARSPREVSAAAVPRRRGVEASPSVLA